MAEKRSITPHDPTLAHPTRAEANGARPPRPPAHRLRTRGAAANPAIRFHAMHHEPVDDGWPAPPEGAAPLLRTEVAVEPVRSILTRNSSPDVPFDRSVNPYRGCEHGCIYCYARPSHAWLDLSPGLDFETRILARPEAARLLRRALARKRYKVAPIALGTNTDPWQPVEGRLRITREVLELLAACRHPVAIVTRGVLIERDIDLLREMAALGLVHVGITVTTLEKALARRMEPRAPAPLRRIETIRRLAAAGIPVRVMVAPVIPGLTDSGIEAVLEAAARAGARSAAWVMLRLPHEVAPLFADWLRRHYPERAAKVLARIAQSRGGRLYDARWHGRMRGEGPHAELVASRFALACRRFGLDRPLPPLRCDRFIPPEGDDRQLRLF